jgi:perosamine synthetase
MKPRVCCAKPSITEKEVAYANDAARNGWGDRYYEYIAEFEKKFREFTGTRYAIATSCCTGALHMGLAALGIGRDDEVILADTTWIASAAPITYLGAKPIFVDVLPDTWCIDPGQIEAAITPKTKAIIAVHLYGNLCEMDQLLSIGAKHGVPVIEDSAEAIGSYWRGHHAGTVGMFGTFSFHGSKTLTTGEGGMFITADHALYEKVLTLSNHGRAAGQTKQYWPSVIGFKYKLSNIQAAIGCGQMDRVDELIRRKREIFDYYHRQLIDMTGLSMNPEKAGTTNGYWMPTAVFAPETGITYQRLSKLFEAENIDGRGFFHPITSLPMFEPKPSNRISYDLPDRAVNLPSYHDMTDADQDRVIEVIKRAYAENARP